MNGYRVIFFIWTRDTQEERNFSFYRSLYSFSFRHHSMYLFILLLHYIPYVVQIRIHKFHVRQNDNWKGEWGDMCLLCTFIYIHYTHLAWGAFFFFSCLIFHDSIPAYKSNIRLLNCVLTNIHTISFRYLGHSTLILAFVCFGDFLNWF